MKRLLKIYLLSIGVFLIIYPWITKEPYSIKLILQCVFMALGVPLAFAIVKEKPRHKNN